MKRIQSIILIFCIVTTSFSCTVFAGSNIDEIIVNENYELGSGFNFENADIKNTSFKGVGKALSISINSSENTVIESDVFAESLPLLSTDGGAGFNVVTSFDIVFENIVEKKGNVNVLLTSSYMIENYNDRTAFLRLEFSGEEKAINAYYLENSQLLSKKAAELSDNKVYRLRIVTEVVDKYGYKLIRHKSISVNGVQVLSKLSYTSTNMEKLPYYDIFQLWAMESAGVNVLLDNIEVRKFNVTDTAINRDLLISEIRKADEMVNVYTGYYSKNNIETLNESAKAALSVYGNAMAVQSEIDEAYNSLNKVITTVESESVRFREYENFENYENILFENVETVYDETIGIGKAAHLKDSCVNSLDFEKSALFNIAAYDAATIEGKECFVETEFDVFIDDMKSGGSAIIALTSDEMVTNYNDTTGFFKITFNGATGKAIINHSDLSNGFTPLETEIGSFETGKWNRIRVVAQITDENANDSKLIKAVYLNGKEVLLNTNFTSVNTNKLPYYNKLQIRIFDCEMYFDNFSVKKYNKATNAPPSKDLLISGLRAEYETAKLCTVGNKIGEYSKSSVDRYMKKLGSIYDRCIKPSVTDSDMSVLYEEFEVLKALFVPNDCETVISENFEITNSLFPDIKTAASAGYETGTVIYFSGNGADLSNKFDIYASEDGVYTELEFDFMTKNIAGTTASLKVSGFYYNIIFDGTSGNVLLEAENGQRFNIYGISESKWNRINLISQTSGEIKNICVYIDGECRLNETIAEAKESFEVLNIEKINFENSGFFMDNVTVRKGSVDNEIKSVSVSETVAAMRNAEKWLEKYHDEKECEEYINLKSAYENAAENDADASVINDCIEKLIHKEDYFEVNYLSLTGKNGERESYFKDAVAVEGVSLVKNTKTAAELKLSIAMYDNNGVLKLAKQKEIFFDEGRDIVTVPIPVNIPEEVSETKVYMWSDDMVPYMQGYSTNMPETSDGSWTVYLNETEVRSDAEPVLYNDGDIMLLSANLVNWFGASLEKHGNTYRAERDDGRFISFTSGTSEININGETERLDSCITEYFGSSPMISAYKAAEAFDGVVNVNKAAKKITIINEYTEPDYREEDSSEIMAEGGNGWAKYSIPNIDPDATVEVWVRFNECDMPSCGDFLTADGKWNSSFKNNADNSMITYWRKLHNPKYENGAFRGSFGGLWVPSRTYDMKVKVSKGEYSDTFVVRKAFVTDTDYFTTPEQAAIRAKDGLLLKPTFENIGYYLDEADSSTSCSVFFRKKGESVWNEAYDPYYDSIIGQYRGSIVKLEADTEYEVKAVIEDASGNILKEFYQTTKTWGEDVKIEKIYKLSDIYSGDGMLVLDGLCGTENGWIKIDGESAVLNAEKNSFEAVLISDCKYVILENLTIKGGYRCGINITGGSEHIRIRNCDVSGWGRVGILDETIGNYIADGTTVNYDAGIRIYDVSNVVVERCTIHDSDAFTNPWNSESWSWVHPAGTSGIICRANEGLVLRYNNIIGNDIHRWNDGVEGIVNGYREGGLGHDSDIYGNMIAFCEDDGLEVDGGGMNVRIYQNRIENGLCGISTAPVASGPLYIYENLITNMGTLNGDLNAMIKAGATTDGIGGTVYMFNNTFDSVAPGLINTAKDTNYVTRNNIIAARRINGMALKNTETNISGSNDYDMLSKRYEVCEGDEQNGISGVPEYRGFEFGDFYPASVFAGIDKGQYLENFSSDRTVGSSPDIGAIEYGGKIEFLPYRPIYAYADKYYIEVPNGAEETINIVSDEAVYVDESFLPEWLDVISQNTENGLCIRLFAKITDTEASSVNGMLFVANGAGYRIPITIKCICKKN